MPSTTVLDRDSAANQPFNTRFALALSDCRVDIESDRAYWGDDSIEDRVRLTDTAESLLLLTPAEALSVAAALQAVAVDMLEQQSREGVAA